MFMETLGSRLKLARTRRELTQADVSRRSGVAQGDISKLENGTVAGSTKVVQLARALECDPYWLATGEGLPYGQPAAESLEFDGRGGNVVGIEVRGASEFLEKGVDIDHEDASTKGVILGSGVHNGYALKVRGDRNAPAIKDGQFLVIEAEQSGKITPGDLGLFTLMDGTVLLRELLRETEDAFHVDSAAWGARQTLRKADVQECEAVIAIVSASRWKSLEK